MRYSLPLLAAARTAANFLGGQLHVALLLFGPLAALDTLATLLAPSAPVASGLLRIGAALASLPASLVWQRRLLRASWADDQVEWRVGRELSLLARAVMRAAMALLLPALGVATVALAVLAALRLSGPLLGYEAVVGGVYLLFGATALASALVVAPAWLLLPAAAMERALGWADAKRLAAGNRVRLALVGLLALPAAGAALLLGALPLPATLVMPIVFGIHFVAVTWGGALQAACYRALVVADFDTRTRVPAPLAS